MVPHNALTIFNCGGYRPGDGWPAVRYAGRMRYSDGGGLDAAERADLGPASLALYDVSTLYFETGADDGVRESGFSKECRLKGGPGAASPRSYHRRPSKMSSHSVNTLLLNSA